MSEKITNGTNRHTDITNVLEQAYAQAEGIHNSETAQKLDKLVSSSLYKALTDLSAKSDSASTGFTNIVTGLGIKAAYPKIDVRYHQVQIQNPQHFNHRSVSESSVYPWLAEKEFNGAKSGWQTRTFERPKPYTLTYDENIGAIKDSFLICYDEITQDPAQAQPALVVLCVLQMKLRDGKRVHLAVPNIDDIEKAVTLFDNHFQYSYSAKGASRLPVLAIYAIYKVLVSEIGRYEGCTLGELASHSAADSQTGATGDIEVFGSDGKPVEALEIKHGIPIDVNLVDDIARKISTEQLERYYVLTTHSQSSPDLEMKGALRRWRERIGCQIIVNGVVPTIRYYLRLLNRVESVFPNYVELLATDPALAHEQRSAWNELVVGKPDERS